MGNHTSIAWALVVALCVAFTAYAAIDAKLDWIAFGQTYERNQNGMIQALNEMAKKVQQLESKPQP